MRKTFNEILDEEFNLEENYSITSGDVDDLRPWALKLMNKIREATLKEASEKAELNINTNDWQKRWVDKDSILNLDKDSIEIYEER